MKLQDRPKATAKTSSRRDFLRDFFRQSSEAALKAAEAGIVPQEVRFVRPPGALPEVEFLQACSQCGDCVPACPHGTIFMLGAHTGGAEKTPALDLTHRACHLCEDFPCIAACEPGALQAVEAASLRFASIRINQQTCLPFLGPECGVCVSVCPVPGAIALNSACPEINPEACVGCAVCREACVVTPSAISVHPLAPG